MREIIRNLMVDDDHERDILTGADKNISLIHILRNSPDAEKNEKEASAWADRLDRLMKKQPASGQ